MAIDPAVIESIEPAQVVGTQCPVCLLTIGERQIYVEGAIEALLDQVNTNLRMEMQECEPEPFDTA
jgi:hypothetical protein